jgi:hypothetical protein
LIANNFPSLNAGPSFLSFYEFEKFKIFAESQLSAIDCSLLEINTNLQEIEKIRSETEALRKLNEELQSKIEKLDEKATENSLEIIGITVQESSNLPVILKTIGENIKCLIWPSDIKKIYSHKITRNNTSQDKIVVEFSNQLKKEEFLKAGRKFSKQGISLSLPDQLCRKIFVNQELPHHKKFLLYNTKEFAKFNGYKFVWIHKSQILLKRNESATPIYVRSLDDLPSDNVEAAGLLPEHQRIEI